MTDEEAMGGYIDAMRPFVGMRDHLWGLLMRVAEAQAALRVVDLGDRADQLGEVREFLAFSAELVQDAAFRAAEEAMGVEAGP
jgi:hypothetical protein